MRLAAFVVSFCTALLMAGLCLVGLVLAALRPQAEGAATLIYCGPLLALPFLWWGLAEWLAWRKGRSRSERQAALCSTVFGGLLLFVGAAGLAEGSEPPEGLQSSRPLLAIVLLLGAWLTASGVMRIRSTQSPDVGGSDEDHVEEDRAESSEPTSRTNEGV